MNHSRALAELATNNHGIVTRSALRAVGVPDSTVSSWAETGRIHRVHPGVFMLAGTSESWTVSVAAAVAAAGPGAAASHRCAAALRRLDGLTGRTIEVLSTRHDRRPRSGIVVHETRELAIADRTVHDGIPVTSVERTLIDIGRYWPVRRVGACLDDAVRRGLTTYDAVAERLVGLARRGRPGIRTMRQVLADREVLGEWESFDFEGTMLRLLLASGLGRPQRQHPVIVNDQRYYLDFFYPTGHVGIECDSRRFHTMQFHAEADLRRQNQIQSTGILLLRYTPSDLRVDARRVVDEIREAVRTRSLLA